MKYDLNGFAGAFVTKPFRVVQSREELIDILYHVKQSDERILENYDLSHVDCSNIDGFEGLTIKNVIFSHYREDTSKRSLSLISFVGSSLENVCFAHSELIRCNFDGAIIQGGDFFFCLLSYCRFRGVMGYCLDFRYSQIASCSMSTCKMVMCDFYMAEFRGSTAFVDSHFMYCSLTSATFSGNCLTMDNLSSVALHPEEKKSDNWPTVFKNVLSRSHRDVNLVQDDINVYQQFAKKTNWIRINPCGDESSLAPDGTIDKPLECKIYIADEARKLYTVLSGIYTGKGLFKDSNRAYRMAKRKELEYSWLSARRDFRDKNIWLGVKSLCKCISPLISKSLGYGYKWSIIVLWFVILVFGYSLYSYLTVHGNYLSSLTGSMNNSMGPYEQFIQRINEVAGSLEPAIGTLLIGFLGFVIANRIRNNS